MMARSAFHSLVPWLWLVAACGGGQRAASDAAAASPPTDVFDAAGAATPAGEMLAFGMRDGAIRNYFVRQGPVAAHVLTRSGPRPRLIAAFPAENQGIGVWFSPADDATELSAGAAPDSEPRLEGGELQPVVYERGARGVRLALQSSAHQLSTELVLLGNVRTLRDYGYGACLEDAAQFPALRNETIQLGPSENTLRIRREQIDGHSLELWIAGRSGTTLALRERASPARAECPPASGSPQPSIELASPSGVELELIALADDEPLTPIATSGLLSASLGVASSPGQPLHATPSLELSALAFLSYDEKLLAGSWRFLTYFGRDTLLSLWLLLPALDRRVVEAGIGAVLDRVQLEEGVAAPEGGSIARGDVAHEEELGDYAAWKNSELSPPPSNLRQPRYDYKMVDDDFLLPPLLLALAQRLDAASPARELARFLARRRGDGRRFEEAALANLELMLARARPYADDARAPRDKASALIALHPDLSVGQWRDSATGLAFGRHPFDVNAALVPAALEAAGALYERLARPERAAEARRLRAAWRGVEELFRIDVPLERARANVASYAAALGLADVSGELEADPGAASGQAPVSVQYAIALDSRQRPLPVVHTDHGFVLAFSEPPEPYLRRVAALSMRSFPAGLASPAGVVVANPAFAEPDFAVTDPRDDVRTPLRELFTPAHYHGAVIWSWQQALLAQGLRRQLARGGLATATRAALETAECALWRTIDATRAGSTRELWSWAPGADGRPELRPFGTHPRPGAEAPLAALPDADESNAIQLWSTVYLAVHAPTPAENPRCARPAAANDEAAGSLTPRRALAPGAERALLR